MQPIERPLPSVAPWPVMASRSVSRSASINSSGRGIRPLDRPARAARLPIKLTPASHLRSGTILLVYLAAGEILDLGANIIILVPILYPAILVLGIDPIQFGIITILGLSLGLVTPPVGACLFVASSIARVPVLQVASATLPFLIAVAAVIAAIILIPEIATWLPQMMRR